MSRIDCVDIVDLRVPTSDTLLGSDPFHKKPNYSTVLPTLTTDDGLIGSSVNFTAGAGHDWIAYGVKDLAQLIEGRDLAEFIADPGGFYRLLVDHHQLRWLADGVAPWRETFAGRRGGAQCRPVSYTHQALPTKAEV